MANRFGGPSEKMSVLINFLLQNTKLVLVLSKICPNFAGHVWQDWQISWTRILFAMLFTYMYLLTKAAPTLNIVLLKILLFILYYIFYSRCFFSGWWKNEINFHLTHPLLKLWDDKQTKTTIIVLLYSQTCSCGHLYLKVTLFLSCDRKFLMNWTSFNRSPAL